MRCISKYGRYGVQIRPHMTEAYANGAVVTKQEQVIALFSPDGLMQDERELAFSVFSFNGSKQEMDEATVVPPDHRIGVFDSRSAQLSYGWTDEMRLEVEYELQRVSETTGDFIIVPDARHTPPWPRYNDYEGPPSALVRKLVDEGYDLRDVLDYEASDDGLQREQVIAALTEALEEGIPVEEEVLG